MSSTSSTSEDPAKAFQAAEQALDLNLPSPIRHHGGEPERRREVARLVAQGTVHHQERGSGWGPRRVSSLRPSGASWAWPGERERHGRPGMRQPDEVWWSSLPGTCRWPGGRFFLPRRCRRDGLMLVLSSEIASSLRRTNWWRCNCSKTWSRTPAFDHRFIRV